jgi:cytosine/uracil/thiamine/allantoin permease
MFGGNIIEEGIGMVKDYLNKDLKKMRIERNYALKIAKLESDNMFKQVSINRIEARSRSLFVAGWRPFIGWMCGIALAYAFIGQPFLNSFFDMFDIKWHVGNIDTSTIYNLVVAMLGLAGLRTYEKQKDIDTKRIMA